VRINDEKIDDPNLEITPAEGMVVQVGKRKFARLKLKN
jgi:tyrosyl-tRNA synthetase